MQRAMGQGNVTLAHTTARIVAALTTATICALSQASPSRATIISTVFNPTNGHTYHEISRNTWTNAEAEAISLGGPSTPAHLVTINDAIEQAWINTNIGGRYWIGLTDNEAFGGSEGNFVWVSGEALTYTNWAGGEPNNEFGVEDYVEFRGDAWNDLPNSGSSAAGTLRGIVEVVPEPSTALLLASGLIGLAINGRRRRA